MGNCSNKPDAAPPSVEKKIKATSTNITQQVARLGNRDLRKKARDYNEEGLAMSKRGDLTGALKSFRKSLRVLEPEEPESLVVASAYNNSGTVLMEKGDYQGALAEYDRALEIREAVPSTHALVLASTHHNKGSALEGLGDYNAALMEYERALLIRQRKSPGSLTLAQSFISIASIWEMQGEPEEALIMYRRALSIQQEQVPKTLALANTYNTIASLLFENGDMDAALQEHSNALSIEQHNSPNSIQVATTHVKMGELLETGALQGALQEFETAGAIRKDKVPGSLALAEAYSLIGSVLEQQGKFDEAIKEYRRALAIQECESPDSEVVAQSHGNLGSVLVKKGQVENALLMYQTGLAIQELHDAGSLEAADLHVNIGMALKAQGDLEGTIGELKKALRIQRVMAPNSLTVAKTRLNLGSAYKDCGDLESAINQFREALDILRREAPTAPEVNELFNFITMLEEEHGNAVQIYIEVADDRNTVDFLTVSTLSTSLSGCTPQSGHSPPEHRNIPFTPTELRGREEETEKSIGDADIPTIVLPKLAKFSESMDGKISAVPEANEEEETDGYFRSDESVADPDKEAEALTETSSVPITPARAPVDDPARFKTDPLKRATAHNNDGVVLQDAGDLDGALREFRMAVEIQERELPGSLTLATSYLNVGYVLQDQNQLTDALVEYKKALHIQRRLEPDSLSVATTYNNIGSVKHKLGDLNGALKWYRKDLAIQERESPISLEIATSYNNIGMLLKEQGDCNGALEEHRKALKIQECISPVSLACATTYSNISSILKEQNDLEDALKEGKKALMIRKRESPISLALATSYNNVGSILMGLKQYKEAWKYYKWARELLVDPRLSLMASHPTLAKCNLELGRLCLMKKKYNQALLFAEDIIRVLPDYIWAYEVKGRALKALGRIQDASDAFDEALSRSPDYGDAYVGKLGVELELKKIRFFRSNRGVIPEGEALAPQATATEMVANDSRKMPRYASTGYGWTATDLPGTTPVVGLEANPQENDLKTITGPGTEYDAGDAYVEHDQNGVAFDSPGNTAVCQEGQEAAASADVVVALDFEKIDTESPDAKDIRRTALKIAVGGTNLEEIPATSNAVNDAMLEKADSVGMSNDNSESKRRRLAQGGSIAAGDREAMVEDDSVLAGYDASCPASTVSIEVGGQKKGIFDGTDDMDCLVYEGDWTVVSQSAGAFVEPDGMLNDKISPRSHRQCRFDENAKFDAKAEEDKESAVSVKSLDPGVSAGAAPSGGAVAAIAEGSEHQLTHKLKQYPPLEAEQKPVKKAALNNARTKKKKKRPMSEKHEEMAFPVKAMKPLKYAEKVPMSTEEKDWELLPGNCEWDQKPPAQEPLHVAYVEGGKGGIQDADRKSMNPEPSGPTSGTSSVPGTLEESDTSSSDKHLTYIAVMDGNDHLIVVDDVVQSDTLLEVKKLIFGLVGIPTDQQELSFRGQPLDDDILVENCGIKEGGMQIKQGRKGVEIVNVLNLRNTKTGVDVDPIDITVKTLMDEKSIDLEVSPLDAIFDVKLQIQCKHGIPIEQQHIFFQNKELKDWRSLSSYNVENAVVLQLVLHLHGRANSVSANQEQSFQFKGKYIEQDSTTIDQKVTSRKLQIGTKQLALLAEATRLSMSVNPTVAMNSLSKAAKTKIGLLGNKHSCCKDEKCKIKYDAPTSTLLALKLSTSSEKLERHWFRLSNKYELCVHGCFYLIHDDKAAN